MQFMAEGLELLKIHNKTGKLGVLIELLHDKAVTEYNFIESKD